MDRHQPQRRVLPDTLRSERPNRANKTPDAGKLTDKLHWPNRRWKIYPSNRSPSRVIRPCWCHQSLVIPPSEFPRRFAADYWLPLISDQWSNVAPIDSASLNCGASFVTLCPDTMARLKRHLIFTDFFCQRSSAGGLHRPGDSGACGLGALAQKAPISAPSPSVHVKARHVRTASGTGAEQTVHHTKRS
ncbi:hypothetical protein RRG08_041128 [Elysia crispata]|uniref:Uncharacterized protein n=1 Tax=Elysia crispata TaxID=231223 RepID=A0AAE0XXM9_9GAST|nr:hypothetical protein RRG08_041128 [Elysia crispata]